MDRSGLLNMLALNLKLVGRKSRENVLISIGGKTAKNQLLPFIQKLSKLRVIIYATEHTSKFLKINGVDSTRIYKISEQDQEPNVRTFLAQNKFDLVINTYGADFKAKSKEDATNDGQLIRTLAVMNQIPLITDIDVITITIDQLVDKHENQVYRYKLDDESEPWNLARRFLQLVDDRGGYACHHAHFDKAYLISPDNLMLSEYDMQKKWELYQHLKENYTKKDLIERMSRGIEVMINQGVTHCRTFVDADNTVKQLPIDTFIELREQYKDKIHLQVAIQPLQGVLEVSSRRQFEKACEKADIIGGLPSRDRSNPSKHLDFIMSIANNQKKTLDIHADQENNPYENETELILKKAIEYKLEGRIRLVHAISIAAKPEDEQGKIIQLIKDTGTSVIVCPSAALSMKQMDVMVPSHNSIAPIPKLLKAGIDVSLGMDNIADPFMPIVDGDMWTECRFLMEACRFYNIEKVADIACNKKGFNL